MTSLRRWLRIWNRDRVRQLREARRRNAPGRVLRLEALEDRVLPSAAGPYIISYTPSEVRNSTFDHIDVTFNEAIDATTFTKDDVTIRGPSVAVPVTEVDRLTDSTFRVLFPTLTTRGSYQASIGPNIADLAGNLMDQNQNGVAGETPGDVFTASLVYINANVILTSPTTITESNTTYDGKDLLIDGATVMIDGPHNFNSVHLVHGGVLTHDADTATQTHKLDLTVTEQVIVDATSRIDVTGKGYLPGRTTGNTATGGATGRSGGSYGGLGGSSAGTANAVYGDYANPNDWGSGSGVYFNAQAGGGLVRLTSASLSLDGQILANGVYGGPPGGSSGGGVYVSVTALSGQGSIRADGETSSGGGGGGGGGGRIAVYASDFSAFDISKITARGGSSDHSYSGGSGTVYIRDTDEAHGTIYIDGTRGGVGWTPLGLPDPASFAVPDAVVVRGPAAQVGPQHPGMALSLGSLSVTGGAYFQSDGPLTVQGAIAVDASTLVATAVTAGQLSLTGGTLLTTFDPTAAQVYKVQLDVAGAVTVDSSSRIDVTGKGYANVNGAGGTTGNTTSGGSTLNSGGSYGGLGGIGHGVPGQADGQPNQTYDDFAQPNDWGSAGASGYFTPDGATAGGGLVRLAAGSLRLDGQLLADGVTLPYSTPRGGGSGGGVFINVGALSGSGQVSARGADGHSSNDFTTEGGGGGGGGRIAVWAQDLSGFNTAHFLATGGAGARTAPAGGAGTVYVRNTAAGTGTLLVDDLDRGGATPLAVGDADLSAPLTSLLCRGVEQIALLHEGPGLVVSAPLTLTAGAQMTVNAATFRGPVTVSGGATLTAGPGVTWADVTADGSTLVTDGRQDMASLALLHGTLLTDPAPTAAHVSRVDLHVSGAVTVDASSRIDVTGQGYLPGRTSSLIATGGATGSSGGSYGGSGGSNNGLPNVVYGDPADPEDPGSGDAPGGGTGGGLVRLAAQTLQIDGQLLAEGTSGPTAGGNGGGSGGGVSLDVQTLRGGGFIRADGAGGNGDFYAFGATGGGGAGGRVAIYVRDDSGFNVSHVTANGSTGFRAPGGAPGTIHIVLGNLYTHARWPVPIGINGGYVPLIGDHVLLQFNRPIDVSSFDPAAFTVDGQMGHVTATGITLVGDRLYRIDLSRALTEDGPYYFSLPATLRDAAGYLLDQNANGIPGEADDTYSWTYLLDTVPPRVTQHSPAGDVAGTVDHVDVWFSEAIDGRTVTAGAFAVSRPDGQALAVTSIQPVGLNRYRVSFAPQTLVGQYHVRIGPGVSDLAGNPLDQAGADAGFNIVPVDLGLNNLIVASSQFVAGESVTVSWNGMNRTGAPLLGDWTDGVYLSADDKWDIGDTLLATVPHTGGLTQNQVYSGSATVVIPGALPGNYHILVRSDVYNQEKEGTGETNNIIASAAILLTVHQLSANGAPVSGILTSSDPIDYYALHLAAGDNVALALNGHLLTGVNELYVSLESIPTRLQYDYAAVRGEDQTNRQSQTLAWTVPPGGGTYYVLVYGAQVDSSSGYDLFATTGPFLVTSITPDRNSNRIDDNSISYHWNNGYEVGTVAPVGRVVPATITVSGAGFTPTTAVAFIGSDGSVRTPAAVHYQSPTTMTLDLDVSQWPADVYDVRITKGTTTYTEPHAFTVVAGGVPHLETKLIVPSAVGSLVLVPQTLWIEYKNTGDAAMPAPLFTLTGTHGALLTTDRSSAVPVRSFSFGPPPSSVTRTIQVMGTGSGATPGILQPGDAGRIPVYFLGLSELATDHTESFSLSSLTADDVSWSYSFQSSGVEVIDGVRYIVTSTGTNGQDWSVNWNDPSIKPPSVPTDAWQAVTTNLAGEVGSQWGDYVVALADDANFLHSVGQDSKDVGALWNYEVAQASAALSPVQYLAGAVDASVPAPGLPLTFSRVYGEPIISRYKLGSLGRGWSDNWDVSAETESNGDVVLHGPGGVDRFFTHNPSGSYTAAPGDYGTLTLTSGAYRLTETDQTVWQFRTDGLLDSVADSNGNRITLGYTNGKLTSLTHSSGQQLLIAYNAAGRIASVTDPATGRATTYDYDASGEYLVRVTEPGNRVTTYSYDTGTNLPTKHALLSVAYPDGTHDFFAYDTHGRLSQMNGDGNAGKLTFTYDTAGGVAVTDATGRQTFLAYGLGGQLAQVRDADGRIVNLGQNTLFQLAQLIGPAGEKYSYSYDTHGNLTGVRDPLRQATSFTYDPTFNQLTSVTDARGNGMTYGYDTRGNLTSITYADNTSETFTYDARGNVLTATNRRNQTVAYTYNAAGEVMSKDYLTTPGTDFSYTYDVAGNLTSATDATGTTLMTYDPATDLLTSITYPGGHSFTFQYDAAGRRTKRTDEAGNVENYFYDAAGRLDHMTDGTGALIVQYAYDAAGRLSKKTLGNGVYTTYEYDDAGNVLHLVNFEANGTILSRYDYTYDDSGRRTSMTTLDGTQTYGYDPLGQLTSVTYPDGHTVSYTYDAAGNRVQVLDNGTTTAYTTNNLNQYTAVGGATYTYDADGNMTSMTQGGVTTQYTYDIENRLIGVSTPTDTWTYSYDAFGNRIAATHNGVTTNYVIDPTGLGNVAAEYNGSGQLIARYDDGYGLLDQTDAAGNSAYYTFSAIGNTSELTSATGGVLNQYNYDPFGVSLGKTETVANPFQYVGEYGVMDDGLKLHMGAREYSPGLGRFYQSDPTNIEGGANLYAYGANDPVQQIDPAGLKSWSDLSNGQKAAVIVGGVMIGGAAFTVAVITYPIWLPVASATLTGLAADAALLYGANYSFQINWLGLETTLDDGISVIAQELLSSTLLSSDGGWELPPDMGNPWDWGLFLLKEGVETVSEVIETPVFPRTSTTSTSTQTVRAADPNDKLGPTGYGDAAYVTSDSTMAYQVQFENESDATGPARQIVVTDTLDPNLDLNTFQLSEITFANQTISVPPGLDHYETTVPMNANGANILVDVQAALDRDTRTLTLTLRAIDPTTGWIPEDPLVGLLYPDDDTGRGQGSIGYSAAPLAGLPSGTIIDNRASIVFDYNDPIDTPLVQNTLDAGPPTSHVLPLPAVQTGTSFTVQWTGQDETGGSGIAGYNVYISADGGPYVLLIGDTTDTSTTIVGQAGHTYAFYSVATDNVGHVEPTPSAPQATTIIHLTPTLTVTSSSASNTSTYGQQVTFTATLAATGADVAAAAGETITFMDGSITLGTGTLSSSGVATFTTSATQLTAGSHTVTAVYGGDAGFTGTSGTLPGGQTVAQAGTQTVVSSSLNPSPYGQAVTFTARVSNTSGTGLVPTGSVQFSIDGHAFGTPVALDANGQTVSAAISTLSAPSHSITAVYVNSDGNFSGSDDTGSPFTQVISKVTPNFSQLTPSQTITAGTASITLAGVLSAGALVPVGETLMIAAGSASTTATVNSDGSFSATLSTSGLSAASGAYVLTYSYGGDTNFNSASDNSTALTVKTGGRTDVTSQVNTSQSGFFYNRPNRLFYGSLTITNISNATIFGSLVIQLQGLTAGVSLQYAAVTLNGQVYQLPVNNSDPANPTITLSQSLLASLAPGQSIVLSERFSDPTLALIDFNTKVFSDPTIP